MSNIKVVKKGNIIIKEKDTDAESMFIILKGTATVYKNCGTADEVQVATFKPGDFFGEMSLFLNEPRTATIIAQEDIAMLEITRLNAYDFLEKQPAATYMVIRSLCLRIQSLTSKMAGMPETAAIASSSGISLTSAEKPAAVAPPASKLFAEGHKTYTNPLFMPEDRMLIPKDFQCPFCMHNFNKKIPRQSLLKTDKMDPDTRVHYKDIETVYYEVITCPKCFLSAFHQQFEKALSAREKQFYDAAAPFMGDFNFSYDVPRTFNDVFASYYMTMLAAPICFPDSSLIVARVWHRLCWLYADCGDEEMEKMAANEACQKFVEAYTKVNIPADQVQKLSIMIGELYYKQEDYINARKFLFQAKTNSSGTATFSRLADDRLADIKKLIN
jgi:uncharacterized protein (DUF2225 family)